MKKQIFVAGLSMALLPAVVATPIFAAELPAQPKTEMKAQINDTKEAKDTVKPEEKTTEVKTPETKAPEAKTSEVKAPETKTPEAKTSEVKTPEAKPVNKELGYAYLQQHNLLENITAKEDAPFTRAMAATLLANMEKPQLVKENKFSDVKGEDVIAQQINWAASKNIMVGYGNGIFAPDKQMTRQELASVLYRYIINYKNFKPASLSASRTPFADKDKFSSWALDEANILCGIGVMSAKDGNFDPQGLVTVSDAAKAFAQAHDLFNAKADVKNTEAAGKAEDKEVQKIVDKDKKTESSTEAKKDEVKKDDNKKIDNQKDEKKADDKNTSDKKSEDVKTPEAK